MGNRRRNLVQVGIDLSYILIFKVWREYNCVCRSLTGHWSLLIDSYIIYFLILKKVWWVCVLAVHRNYFKRGEFFSLSVSKNCNVWDIFCWVKIQWHWLHLIIGNMAELISLVLMFWSWTTNVKNKNHNKNMLITYIVSSWA